MWIKFPLRENLIIPCGLMTSTSSLMRRVQRMTILSNFPNYVKAQAESAIKVCEGRRRTQRSFSGCAYQHVRTFGSLSNID
jgi:hypothetical protein